MNKKLFSRVRISLPRAALFALAGITLIAGLFDLFSGRWFLAFSAVFFFLGMTDLGRQCPLLLSVQHHINRMKSKNK